MEGNSEAAADQIGHASSGPEVGGKAVRGRFLGQPVANLLILFGGEEPRAARCGFGRQPSIACGAVLGQPLGHGDAVDPQSDGHGGLRPSTQNQMNRSPPYGFQFGSRSFASHDEDVTCNTIEAQ